MFNLEVLSLNILKGSELYASQQSRYCKCSSNHSVFQMFNLGILSLNILKGSELYASQQSRYCNCSSNHSCGNSASRCKQLQMLAGDGSPSKSSIDLIGLETESEWNYIVRSCIIRNTTQNQGSSIISCIEVQLAMAQYDCHPPGVLKCSYQLRQHNSNMLQQLFIISCIEV